MKWPWLVPLALVFVGTGLAFTARSEPPPIVCANSEDRERMRELMLEALDNGFREHTAHLVDVLIKDRKDQPGRAMRGMQPAIVAYVKGRGAITAFNPPPCERMDYPHAQ